jgi:hypothetical protein
VAVPSTSPVEATRTRAPGCSAATASSTFTVPTALTLQTSPDPRQDAPTDDTAASWTTAAGRTARISSTTSNRVGHVRAGRDGVLSELGKQMAADEAAGSGDEDDMRHGPEDRQCAP